MKQTLVRFLVGLKKGPVQVGIRTYMAGGKYLFFLNGGLSVILKSTKFGGMTQLVYFAQYVNRPIEVYSWHRCECCSSERHWENIGVTIRPEITREETRALLKLLQERVATFMELDIKNPNSGMKDTHPIAA